MKASRCSVCGKFYKSYPVILCCKLECFAFEMSFREIYYSSTGNEGVCKDCRNRLMDDKVWLWRHWLLPEANLMCIRADKKGGEKIKYTKAINRIKKINESLEKLPEIKAIIEKNKEEIARDRDWETN